MNSHTLPRALFSALVAGAAAVQPAVALPPSSPTAAPPPPVQVELVDDTVLADLTGKYTGGGTMLVGLRIDLVSSLHNPQGSATASGSLLVVRDGDGFRVEIDSRSAANGNGTAPLPTGGHSATGGGDLQIDGIGQISQIAGDGNVLSNLTSIGFTRDLGGGDFNGRTSSQSGDGLMHARITFLDGGVQLGLEGPGALLQQQLAAGGDGAGGIRQIGQIAGDHMVGSNRLQLQILTAALPESARQQLGVQQALAGLRGLSR